MSTMINPFCRQMLLAVLSFSTTKKSEAQQHSLSWIVCRVTYCIVFLENGTPYRNDLENGSLSNSCKLAQLMDSPLEYNLNVPYDIDWGK